MAPKVSAKLEQTVRIRADSLCEYCHTNERWQYVKFTVDHVLATHLGGLTVLENLALACFHCNRLKGFKLMGIDPQIKLSAPLFNPRQDQWREHFIWSTDGSLLIGHTSVGRATIATLQMNRTRIIEIRRADAMIGRHPPSNDPREKKR